MLHARPGGWGESQAAEARAVGAPERGLVVSGHHWPRLGTLWGAGVCQACPTYAHDPGQGFR